MGIKKMIEQVKIAVSQMNRIVSKEKPDWALTCLNCGFEINGSTVDKKAVWDAHACKGEK